MCKSMIKRRYELNALEILAKRYNTTPDYVRQCVRGYRHSDTAKAIQEDYPVLVEKITQTLKEF